uniref:Uncharacterized protein n=1 Tax=Helianthus annuus TaxID=4232 RepID=A0A251UPL6_HELAN
MRTGEDSFDVFRFKVSSFSWGVREIYRETNQSGDVVDSSGSATDVAFSNSTERVFEVAVEYLRTMGYKSKFERVSLCCSVFDRGVRV